MDALTQFAIDILRDRNFSRRYDDVRIRSAIHECQSAWPVDEGVLAMDVLIACDKAEVREALSQITAIIQEADPQAK